MAQPDNLEARLTAVEEGLQALSARVRVSEHDAAAARVLAGGADRDVSEIRTEIREFREQNNRVLNAMRDDLSDLRTKVDTNATRMDGGFIEIRGRLDAAAAGQQQIVDLLTRLIDDEDTPAS
jgi:predicted  nucleic acid-binding Zn-ribbon protein